MKIWLEALGSILNYLIKRRERGMIKMFSKEIQTSV